MTESLLSFIWRYKFYQNPAMFWESEPIEIISPGEINTHAGPDFMNARIKIGNTVWAGTVEIHVKASDWDLHNHDQNAAFDNVILHVVHQYDKDVYTSKGRKVPAVALEVDPNLVNIYDSLRNSISWIACADKFDSVDRLTVTNCLESAGLERLEYKTAMLAESMKGTITDWSEMFYRLLARSFGFHVNATAFELLAQNLPYKTLRKHTLSIFSLESMMFGVAGFLTNDYSDDEYYNQLKKEFAFFQNKYNINAGDIHLWKFLRLRPGNFPTVRIAQLAALIHHSPDLLNKVIEAKTIEELTGMFIVPLSEYWNNHYSFSNNTKPINKCIGEESVHIIIINTIVPFLFLFGRQQGKSCLEERAINILETLPPENNTIIRNWKELNVNAKSSFDSQALLHLKNEFCDKKRCIQCKIGIKILKGKM